MTIHQATFGLLIMSLILLASCGKQGAGLTFEEQGREVPAFDAARAYDFIGEQVRFGPRVPGTEAHVQAKEYLKDQLIESAGRQNVFVQEFQKTVYGQELPMYNLIASFGGGSKDRIVLAAHWDSRPRAEKDPENPESPILGADDGGSGVSVLLELARILSDNAPPLGVDIVFFDGEDYGKVSDLDNYFLGSRQWGNHPPVPGYSPRFGILLDMVGGENATFSKELYSMQVAPNLVDEIWAIAAGLGHAQLFPDQRGGRVADDHVIVTQTTGIPMINIIHHTADQDGKVQFPPWWHTQNDNMEIIDRETLQAVGDVLLELIYNRIPT